MNELKVQNDVSLAKARAPSGSEGSPNEHDTTDYNREHPAPFVPERAFESSKQNCQFETSNHPDRPDGKGDRGQPQSGEPPSPDSSGHSVPPWEKQTYAFVDTCFKGSLRGPDGYQPRIAMWTRQTKATEWLSRFALWMSAEAVTEAGEKGDVYVGLCLHDERKATAKKPTGRGNSESAMALPGLFIDLDVKHEVHSEKRLPASIPEALGLLADLPTPTAVVNTGHGLHVHWVFDTLWELSNSGEREAAESLMSRFQREIRERALKRGWVLDKTDTLAQLIRPPGTWNRKEEPVRVEFLSFNLNSSTPLQSWRNTALRPSQLAERLKDQGRQRATGRARSAPISRRCSRVAHGFSSAGTTQNHCRSRSGTGC